MAVSSPPSRRTPRVALLPWIACFLALALGPSPADASTQVESLSLSRSTTQAGAHPDLTASFSLESTDDSEIAKDVLLGTPAGLFVNPVAIPRCSAADFGLKQCSPSSQVGLVATSARYEGDPDRLLGIAAVYALLPGSGETARFGFYAPTVDLPIAIAVKVRADGDYGLNFSLQNLPSTVPLAAADLTFWAVPADPTHDSQRFPAGSTGCPGLASASCLGGPTPSAASQVPLFDNPTACGAEFKSSLAVDTYEDPGTFASSASPATPTSGCGALAFSPMLDAALSASETSTTSGLSLGLTSIDEDLLSPVGISESAIESVTAALPSGLTVDPIAASGLTPCTPADFDATGPGNNCPAGSEIGEFAIGAAELAEPLEGSAYFGEPEAPGSYRLFLSASGNGIAVKLIASLAEGPEPRRLQLSLPSLPQIPIDEYLLELAPGAELLTTPDRCGEYTVDATLTPSSEPTQKFLLQRHLTLEPIGGGPCAGPAETVSVTLSPPSLVVDGGGTSVATATVTDAGELPVIGDEVEFFSEDMDEQVGETIDNGDGTYTATISSPTAVGPQTIEAVDFSVDPEAFGTATLLQLAGEGGEDSSLDSKTSASASSPPPPRSPAPTPLSLRLTGKPPHRTHDRTPTFRFASTPSGSRFECELDRHRFQPCASPTTLKKLGTGAHTYKVRVTDISGASRTTAYRFVVLGSPRASS